MKKEIENIKKKLADKYPNQPLEELSEQEMEKLVELLEDREAKKKPYYRSLDMVEAQAISVEAYGYMISMYNIGSLSEFSYEKVIQICMHLYFITQEQVSKSKLDKIITMINFADLNQNNLKEFIDTLINDNRYQMSTQKIKQ
ncbi:MAG: DUF494 family protein [Candidatus Cloacimonadales bacterium]